MQRRTFLEQLTFLAGSLASPSSVRALAPSTAAKLTIAATKVATMPNDFIGLSFESPQLYNPDYFSPTNKTLVEAVKKLSQVGVIRSGGHLSDVSRWVGSNGDFSTPKQETGIERGKSYWEWKLTDPSVRERKDGAITPHAIRNLKGFLDATGWSLIYGLNFGCGSLERAADEASTVAQIMGDKLIAFQIGNEDDQFAGNPAFRPRTFDFAAYFADYKEFIRTVRNAVPNAKFGGPDVATNMRWVTQFAENPDKDAIFLSSHFYAMGPAKDPDMTAEFLLGPNARLAKQIDQVHQAVTAAKGLPYRMTEGNSCFGGGKPGVSDAFASSLWSADYLLQCASAGYIGVNLHGGGDGYYTPIAVGPQLSTELRPLFFGMEFASVFAGADLYACDLPKSPKATAYYGRRGRKRMLAIINKGEQSMEVDLPDSLAGKKPTEQHRLSAPSLVSNSGITLSSESPHKYKFVNLTGYSALLLQWS